MKELACINHKIANYGNISAFKYLQGRDPCFVRILDEALPRPYNNNMFLFVL